MSFSMASRFQIYTLFRREAPKLGRQYLTCLSRGQYAQPKPSLRYPVKKVGNSSVSKPLSLVAARASPLRADVPAEESNLSTSSSYLPAGKEQKPGIDQVGDSGTGPHFFPKVTSKMVAYWLLGSAASIYGIVVFGGLTRLTESGLSITEWRPVTGSLPPMNDTDWESEFRKYRSSPEFKLLNPHMSLSEFKSIYYMEWTHRLWGRVVGITFLLPSIYFIARRKVSAPMAIKLVGIIGLISFQGFLGWWMVKSGLKDDLFAPGSHPRVSQYRLTAHLGMAFICYTAMLWNGLSILRTHKLLAAPEKAEKVLANLRRPELRLFRRSVAALAVLVFCTAMSGALVAGLDAGLIYNEFPYMGEGLVPPKSELFSEFYSHTADKSDVWWRNALENPSLVQLDHRILATTTFSSIMTLWAYTKLSTAVKSTLPVAARKGMHGVVGFVFLQVTLGISTLIYLVPLPLASAHQAGSLALLSSVIILGSRIWVPRQASRLVQQKLHQLRGVPVIHRSKIEGTRVIK